MRLSFVFILGLITIQGLTACAEEHIPHSQKVILGWMEDVVVLPEDLKVRAKLDTGADTSSIHAEDIKIFKKNGEEWVRFKVSNREGKTKLVERRVWRTAKIKRKGKSPQLRPVVKLMVCIDRFNETVEFTLIDRSNFSSIALIGRNFLSGKILVDASSSYLSEPDCKGVLSGASR